MRVRMALGASPHEVVRMVLREGLNMAVAGPAFGVAGALAAERLARHAISELPVASGLAILFGSLLSLAVALVAAMYRCGARPAWTRRQPSARSEGGKEAR